MSNCGRENTLGVVKTADWLSPASYIRPTTALIGHQKPFAHAPVVALMYDCQMVPDCRRYRGILTRSSVATGRKQTLACPGSDIVRNVENMARFDENSTIKRR